MNVKTQPALSTRCVHAGEARDVHGSPHTPVYTTTTFAFPSTRALLDVVEGVKPGSLYTRYGLNPTIQCLEAKLASLEGADAALAFSSGMGAEAALFLAHGRKGIVCLGDAYGGTLELLADQLPQLGIRTALLLGDEQERLDELLADGYGLVFLETPTNPVLEIFDIQALARTVHAHGARLAVDNTFASPVNQQPLALGADWVTHSATKYLGGHSDITAGALMGSAELVAPVAGWRKNLGTAPAPETAGDTAATSAVVDRLHVFVIAPSLGGVESLATQPVTTTHHGLSDAERERRGISGSMIRLSVGLEDAQDLIADLEQALDGPGG
ncbi:MAG: PLP-dependent transferase [Thioalkalivibrio sp.]|nr:PLP-dependent transferase [Thioalkalivibrio sp.]